MKWLYTITVFLCTFSTLSAQQMTVKDSDAHVLMEVTDEGSTGAVMLPSGSAPADAGGKLYNQGGTLYWSGSALLSSAAADTDWVISGTSMRSGVTGNIAIGLSSSSNSKLEVYTTDQLHAGLFQVDNPDYPNSSALCALTDCQNGYALFANNTGRGTSAYLGAETGVKGVSYDNYAVYGFSGHSYGVYGLTGDGAYGVYGAHTSSDDPDTWGYLAGTDCGAYGKNENSQNSGRLGTSSYGAYAEHGGSGNYGLMGSANYGVYGNSNSGCGVYGNSDQYIGVYGAGRVYGVEAFSDTGRAVYANSPTGKAVYAKSASGTAGYFDGDVHVTGTLSKSAGSFRIDHPLDPRNKYLNHSFVESPDMMNVYNGNIILDAHGEADVEMPEWFEALNRDFRYQLTPVGAACPDLHISREIESNMFRIAGGFSGLKVSWQVTGIRRDAYANACRIPVEEDKPLEARGTLLHPQLEQKLGLAGSDCVGNVKRRDGEKD